MFNTTMMTGNTGGLNKHKSIDNLELPPPDNRYGIELDYFNLRELNVFSTDEILEQLTYEQRIDYGCKLEVLDTLKHTKSITSLHLEDEKESDGETHKLPPKLPPYKLFNEGYRCASKNCLPRPNRDPLT